MTIRLVLVAGLAVTLAQDPPPQAPTFRATAAAVMVDVTVLRNGRPLTGLSEADFEVLDNGVAQSVATISYGKLPIDVTVALDVSYSVTGALLDRLRRAVGQLMGDLAKGDRLKLMLFSSRVTRVVDFTTDVQAVERAIRATAAGGGTAVFDAISVALVSAAEPDRRQLVVFFTDGRDSTSTTSPAALHHTAERTTARLSIVVPGPSMSPLSATPAMRAALEAERARTAALWPIAAETGGGLVSFSGNMDLSSTFRRILDEFRSTYVLHYTPRGVERTGFHTLQVNVKRENVTVKARRGYFGG